MFLNPHLQPNIIMTVIHSNDWFSYIKTNLTEPLSPGQDSCPRHKFPGRKPNTCFILFTQVNKLRDQICPRTVIIIRNHQETSLFKYFSRYLTPLPTQIFKYPLLLKPLLTLVWNRFFNGLTHFCVPQNIPGNLCEQELFEILFYSYMYWYIM